MKLLTHNMMTSKCLKGVKTGFPLVIDAKDIKVVEVDYNPEFIARIIPKLEWEAVYSAAQSIGHLNDLPVTVPENFETAQDFLKKAHHVLMEVEINTGELICPETGRHFPINNGIPNMLLNEDEV